MIPRLRFWIKRLSDSRILRASSAMMLASYATMGIGILTGVIVARLLGDVRYGLVLTAIAIVNTIIQFMDIRTSETLIRFIGNALVRDDRSDAWAFFLVGLTADFILMLATVALAILFTPIVLKIYPEQAAIRPLVTIFIFSIPFTAFQGTFSSLLHVFKQFTSLAGATVVNSLILMIAILIALPYGMNAVMWAYVITSGIVFSIWLTLGLRVLFARVPPREGFTTWQVYRRSWREFIPFSFHTSLTQSLKAISSNIDTLVIGALQPIQAVAYFRIGRSAAGLITMPTAPISTVIYPELNEAWAKGDMAAARRLTKRYALLSLAVGTPILIGLGMLGVILVRLIYGETYYDTAPLMTQIIVILGLAIVLESAFRWVRPAAMAQNKPQLVTFYGTFTMALRLVLIIPALIFYGIIGLAYTQLFLVIITILMHAIYTLPNLGLWAPLGIGRGVLQAVEAEQERIYANRSTE